MGVAKRLISGSMFRNLEFLVMVIVTFIMSPFIIHSLGNRMYGFWVLIGTFMGYYGLLDFGLSSAVNRFISQSLGMEDSQEISTIVSTSFVVFLLIGLISILVTAALLTTSNYFIDKPEEMILFRKIISILGVSLALGFPMRVFNGILTSYLRYDITSLVSIAKTVITNIAIYVYLNNGYGLITLAFINFAGSVAQNGCMFLACRYLFPHAKVSLKYFSRQRINKLFKYSFNSFIVQISDLMRFRLDSVVVAAFVNVSAVTYYSIGYRLVEYFIQFMTSCMGIMTPVFSQYEGKKDFESIRSYFLRATVVSNILSIYLGMSIIFYGKPFIRRWMGPDFDTSYKVTLIFIIPVIFALIQVPSINLLYGISKHHFYAISNTCEGVLNLILSLILVRYLGIYGVAFGTAISMSVFKLIIQPVFTCRAIDISMKQYCVDTILVTTLKITLPLLLYFSIARYFLTPEYPNIIGLFMLQTAICLPIVYFVVLGKQERCFIRAALNLT